MGRVFLAGFTAVFMSITHCGAEAAAPASEKPAAVQNRPYVFSMSCKVTACNGDLSAPKGRARAVAWWKKHGFSKLWLESYRHAERVDTALLIAERDAFRAEGFEVCGMITPTMLNDTLPGEKEPRMTVCWSDPVARGRLRAEAIRAAKIFPVVMLDDFLFSCCDDSCRRCSADKKARGIDKWDEYRKLLMKEVCRRDIVEPAKIAAPGSRFIIKYPCWYRHYSQRGYDPGPQAELFGECWIGTETRDANPEPLQACWIVDWMNRESGGRCGGGWYDALDCTPSKFVEQAYYTILGGAKESLVHCYDYLLADDPGRTPFGEKANDPAACRKAFEAVSGELARLAAFLQGAERGPFSMGKDGVSRHEFTKEGIRYIARMNTTGETVAGLAPHDFEMVRADENKSR